MKEIAQRIKVLIDKEGLSNSEFAKRIDLNPSIVSHILSGRNKVSLQVALQIKQAFPKVDLQELLTGNKSKAVSLQNSESFTNVKETVTTPLSHKVEEEPQAQYHRKPSTPLPKFKNTGEKQIEKVIIFYTDKTMESYTP